jgi:integrase
MKLSKPLIDGLKPAATDPTDLWVWDDELPGFGVRVQPSGAKSYVARYRTLAGVQRKQKLARCSDVTLTGARALARKLFAQVAEGKDPRADKLGERDAPTMTELETKYTAEHASTKKKAASQTADAIMWRLHILPRMGDKRVRDVTEGDVLKLHSDLADKKATANRCVALLSKAFNLAEKWGWREKNTNPCHRFERYTEAKRELILTPEQIGALNRTLDRLTAEGRVAPQLAMLVRLLLVTGCRLREVMHARKAWFDLHRCLLVLPDSKTGERLIPLSPLAVEMAKSCGVGEAGGSDWLIPGRTDGQALQNPYRAWALVKAEAGLPAKLRPHDLRHTTGSMMHAAGASQRAIATQLGHNQLATTERYIHGFAADSMKVAGVLGDALHKAMTAPPAPESATQDEGSALAL